MAAIDGVYTSDGDDGTPRFHFVASPTQDDIRKVAETISVRVIAMLRRRGLLHDGDHSGIETPDDAMAACRDAALRRGRFERIDDRGRAEQELFKEDERFARRKKSPSTAEVDGFSVDAGVCFGALDRKGRETLVRTMLRPAIAIERLTIPGDGSVAHRTKHGKGRTSHRVMTPLEAMARIAALVPPPRTPLLRCHGVLAAGSPLRAAIVPVRDRPRCRHPKPGANAPAPSPSSSTLPSSAPSASRNPTPSSSTPSQAPTLVLVPGAGEAPGEAPAPRKWRPSTSYVPWAELVRRTFGVDPSICPRCDGRLEPLAIITKPETIERILSSVTLAAAEPVGPGGSPAHVVLDNSPSGGRGGEDNSLEDWVVGVDPVPPDRDARAPPGAFDCIDAPSGLVM